MTKVQMVIKYLAIAFAVVLCVSIIGGIVTAIASVTSLLGIKGAVGDTQTYGISGEISELRIDIGAAELVIATDDDFRVESNLKHLTVKQNDGVLKIENKKGFWNSYNAAAKLTLYIPEGTEFRKATVKSGAGSVTVDSLTADELKLDLGAGEVNINELSAKRRADIDSGAGKVTINGGSLADLDFDMGVGEVNLTSRLTGKCDFDMGVGSSKLVLIGSSDDYRVDIDKGIGDVTVNDVKVADGAVFGGGDNRVEIDGGVGAITIKFQNANGSG